MDNGNTAIAEMEPYELSTRFIYAEWPDGIEQEFVDYCEAELREWYKEDISRTRELIESVKDFYKVMNDSPDKERFIGSRGEHGASPESIPTEYEDNSIGFSGGTNEFYRASRELDWLFENLESTRRTIESDQATLKEVEIGEVTLGTGQNYHPRYAFFETDEISVEEVREILPLIKDNDHDEFIQAELVREEDNGQLVQGIHTERESQDKKEYGKLGLIKIDENNDIVDLDFRTRNIHLSSEDGVYRLEIFPRKYGTKLDPENLKDIVEKSF